MCNGFFYLILIDQIGVPSFFQIRYPETLIVVQFARVSIHQLVLKELLQNTFFNGRMIADTKERAYVRY